jgi:hypothetical protein
MAWPGNEAVTSRSPGRIRPVSMGADQDHPQGGAEGLQAGDALEATHARQHQVYNRQVGLQAAHQGLGLLDLARLADDVQSGVDQQPAQVPAKVRLVVHDQDAGHGLILGFGSLAVWQAAMGNDSRVAQFGPVVMSAGYPLFGGGMGARY